MWPLPWRPPSCRSRRATGLGSGFVFDDEGHILTAAHVVAGDSTVTVRLADGHALDGEVGGDERHRRRRGQVDRPADLPVAALAPGRPSRVGRPSSPSAAPSASTRPSPPASVARSGRPVQVQHRRGNVVQTDAPINSGNSGGALVDLQGRVIGITTTILTTSGATRARLRHPHRTANAVAQQLISGLPVPVRLPRRERSPSASSLR